MTVEQAPPQAIRTRRVPGEHGVWIVVFGDILVFVVLFCMFLWYRGQDSAGFDAAQRHLSPVAGLLETIVLLTSSLAVVAAGRAERAGRHAASRRGITVAMVLGVLFALIKSTEWWSKGAAGLTPHTGVFYMLYFVLTGLHLGHVLVGLFFLWLVRRLPGKAVAGKYDSGYFEGAGVFWHMVDLIWLLLFPLVYLVH